MTFGPRSAPPAPPSGVLERAFASLGTGSKLALVLLAAGLAIWGIWAGVRRIGRAGRKVLLATLTAVFAIAALLLGTWSLRLPSAAGTGFVLWHQVVRVGAALSATGFAL
ncbi:MAG: hypothetical protein FJ104_02955, partial [Deltaproteobacteria bacterium]|nr:hypothetical protein [Deltaproteobacteria bacterium]